MISSIKKLGKHLIDVMYWNALSGRNSSTLKCIISAFIYLFFMFCVSILLASIKDSFYVDYLELDKQDKTIGVLTSEYYKAKGSWGYITVADTNGTKIEFMVEKDDRDIYRKLQNKEVKVYSIKCTFGNCLEQIEDSDGKIYVKFNIKSAKKRPELGAKYKKYFGVAALACLIMIYLLNFKNKPRNMDKEN